MQTQTVVVAAVVFVAALFIGRRIYAAVRSARNAKAGCTGCGCSTGAGATSDWSKS